MIEDRLRSALENAIESLPQSGAIDHQILRRARTRVGIRTAIAGVMALALIAGASLATTRLIGQEKLAPVGPNREAHWESTPSAPIEGRAGHLALSTGAEMLVWGGQNGSDDPAGIVDGAVFDYAGGEWRTMSDSPLEVSGGRSAVWTGEEMLVWGGELGDGSHGRPDNGAAYDPSSDSWRELPPSPGWSLAGHSAIWTGTEMIVWGGVGMEGRGAAFDPVSGSWRELSPAPVDGRHRHTALWTGQEMVVWGGQGSERPLATGAAYAPDSDSWRELPPAPISARDLHSATWTGEEIIVWGGWNSKGMLSDGAAYNPASNTWRQLPRGPIGAAPLDSSAVWTGREMVVVGSDGALAAYSPRENEWAALPDPPSGRVMSPTLVSEGDEVILWGGLAHDDESYSASGAILTFSAAENDEDKDADQDDEAILKNKIARLTLRLTTLSSQRARVVAQLGAARDQRTDDQVIQALVEDRKRLDRQMLALRSRLDELLGQVDERNQTSFECPHLIPPGPRAKKEMRPAVIAYLDARQPDATDDYHYRMKRMTGRSELGFPAGDCSLETWRRSFRVDGSFKYEEGVTSASASLTYFRVYAGQTKDGWVVWFEAH